MTVHSSTWIVEYSVQYRSIRIGGQAIDNLVEVAYSFAFSLLKSNDGRPAGCLRVTVNLRI